MGAFQIVAVENIPSLMGLEAAGWSIATTDI
jgi:hypothetical protein